MKKLISLVAVVVTAVFATSCVGEGKTEYTVSGYGVVDYYPEAGAVVVFQADDVVNYPPIYSLEFTKQNSGDCIVFTSTIDYTDPANKGNVKYYTVKEAIVEYTLDNNGQMVSHLDTANFYPNELITTNAGIIPYTYTTESFTNHDFLFFRSSHENIKTDEWHSYQLQYDPNQEPTIEDGRRVYDFYLRVIKTQEGKNNTGSYTLNYAFKTNGYLNVLQQKELAAGSDKLAIRFNYISAFDEATKKITWSKAPVVETFLPGKNNNTQQ